MAQQSDYPQAEFLLDLFSCWHRARVGSLYDEELQSLAAFVADVHFGVIDVYMFIIDYFFHDEIIGVGKLVHFLDHADCSNLQKSALAFLLKMNL